MEVRQDSSWVEDLVAAGDTKAFYDSKEWRRCRRKVLKHQHNECQRCKARGRHSRADTVHHVNHLRDRPDLALEEYAPDGSLNLMAICRSCHAEEHPRAVDRWDDERW